MKQFLSLLCSLAICAIVAISCSDDEKVVKTFTVTFDSQGGSSVPSQTINEGDKVSEPTAPTKEGFLFGGWYADAAYSRPWKFSENIVTENMTLYARWTSKTFTVTFNTNGGDPIDSREVAEGGLLAELPVPVKKGSAFEGWYTDQGLTAKFDISKPITSNITLYAKWTTVTREALATLIQQAHDVNDENYTEESYQKMYQKLIAAEKVLNNQDSTGEEIATAYKDLTKAINELEAKPVRATVALNISPQPIEGVIYLNPAAYNANNEFWIHATGIDSDNNESTNNKVIFEYSGLEDWAMERGIEEGMEKINKSDNYLSFIPRQDLSVNAQITITIKSADNTALVQTITLEVIGEEDAKSMFLNMVNALPDINSINFDNFEQMDAKINEIETAYYTLSEADKATTEVINAYAKLDSYLIVLDNYWKVNYTFEGNICIVEGERNTYEPNGKFPVGTYTSKWESNGYDDNHQPEYYQNRMTLNADGSYQVHYRTSNNSDGSNPTNWVLETDGEYRVTGNQTNGGVLYMHEIHYYEDNTPTSKSISTLHNKKIKIRRE